MPKPQSKTGRPPHAPTEEKRQMVASMVLFGLTQLQIGNVLKISEPTLVKYYRDELEATHAKVGAKIATGLAKLAMTVGQKGSSKEGALTAAIFFLKTRGGWKETSAIEASGPGGGPIPFVDLSKLNDKELAVFERLIAKTGIAAPKEDA